MKSPTRITSFSLNVFPEKVLKNHLWSHSQVHLGVYKCNIQLFFFFDPIISIRVDSISLDLWRIRSLLYLYLPKVLSIFGSISPLDDLVEVYSCKQLFLLIFERGALPVFIPPFEIPMLGLFLSLLLKYLNHQYDKRLKNIHMQKEDIQILNVDLIEIIWCH